MIRRLLPFLMSCAVGCAPIVTHGPRVEPGLQIAATLGAARNVCDTGCTLSMVPQLGGAVRYGRPAEDGRVGYSVGATFSAGGTSSEADLYLQLPTAPTWAAGGGVLLSPAHVMPYLQAGWVNQEGSGFYTTQGFAFLARRPRHWNIDEIDEAAPRYWAPTIAYRAAHSSGAVHFYLSGAIGWMDIDVGDPFDPDANLTARQPVRVLMAGVSLEAGISGLFSGGRPPRALPNP